MHWNFDEIVELFSDENHRERLSEGLHGLEKESLRVLQNGDLAMTPHPKSLGSSFTDPNITTDFSESQLELITLPFPTPDEALDSLGDLHRRVIKNLPEDELIWPFSMPCRLPAEDDLPIAQYGPSKEAQQKEIYRKGLALRYGKMMQMLCGVHYNFSFSDAFWDVLIDKYGEGKDRQTMINECYLAISRNFMRHRWLLVYLFGASPVMHKTYGCRMMSSERDKAVSLRLSRCGYANPAKLNIPYDSFDHHIEAIEKAVNTPYPKYTKLGVEKDGERVQLNDHQLQIINEYYAPIRLKPSADQDDLLKGLKENGARYLELRLFDVNPLQPFGVDLKQLHFTHLFLIFCLFNDNPSMTEAEFDAATEKQQDVALKGRHLPDERLKEMCELLTQMSPIAELMPEPYQNVIDHYLRQCQDPSSLPWSRILEELGDDNYIEYGLSKARYYHKILS
jgi:glutamate--cysteine ligase